MSFHLIRSYQAKYLVKQHHAQRYAEILERDEDPVHSMEAKLQHFTSGNS